MNQSEHDEQVALFEWAASMSGRYPALDLMFAIPNGGKRTIGTARKLKDEGVKAGVPDVCLPVPVGRYHGLYVEMKAEYQDGRHGSPSQAQKAYLKALTAQGYRAVWVIGWERAAAEIQTYLEGAA